MGKYSHFIVLAKAESAFIDKLLEIYRENRLKARVVYFNQLDHSRLTGNKLTVFVNDDGSFEIVHFVKKWGISKTSIIYNRESKAFSIYKTDKGFFIKIKNNIKPLTYHAISQVRFSDEIIKFLLPHFPPLELIKKHGLMHAKSFNYILEHKLTSLKKMLAYEYKAPYPIAKKIHEKFGNSHNFSFITKHYSDYIDNIENLNVTLIEKHPTMLIDTIKMGKTLNRKVNMAWSEKRLKEEHDDMSYIITDIVLTECNAPLSNAQLYLDFAKFTGYKILKSTKELALEGRRLNHCVGGYASSVNSGGSAIFSIQDYTLELTYRYDHSQKGYFLKINQFNGYGNAKAPKELYGEVQEKLDEFVEKTGLYKDGANYNLRMMSQLQSEPSFDDLLF